MKVSPHRLLRCTVVFSALLLASAARADYSTSDQDWVTVKDESLTIKPGNALDFGSWVEPGPAGQHGQLIAGKSGQMVFTATGDSPHFSCVSVFRSPYSSGLPLKKDADFYAKQLRLHGYNLARFHYVDAKLMSDLNGKALDTKDFGFNPELLDAWFYYLDALKKQGIYWVLDAQSSANGAMAGVFPMRSVPRYHFDIRVFFDPDAQQHWKQLVDHLLGAKNPYTGMRVIDDPALVGVVLFNENQLNFLARHHDNAWPPEGLVKKYNGWLSQHYASDQALKDAWGDLAPDESMAQGTVRLPEKLNGNSPRETTAQQFIADVQSGTATWMTKYLRDLGYKGFVTAYNASITPADIVSKAELPWIDDHSYVDGNDNRDPGATITQGNAIKWMVPYLRNDAMQRMAGKPFSLTEFGQPFWNRYRFETGVEVPAMEGLQGWDFACLHGSADVDYSMKEDASFKQYLFPNGGGLDPVVRAAETLKSLLRLRDEVRPSTNLIRYDLGGGAAMGLLRPSAVPSDLAWLSRVEMTMGNDVAGPAPVLVVRPQAMGAAQNPDKAGQGQTQQYITVLRKRGVLGAGNITDLAQGILQSDTGQIVLDQRRGNFSLTTSMTEAAAFVNPANNLQLGLLKVNSSSVEGLLAVSALDGQPLASSHKMLIIYATDAENTGMRFTAPDRKTLVALGTLPVRIRHGVADISLTQTGGGTYNLHSLHLNGDLGDDLPVRAIPNGVRLMLDNTAPSHGPTTFFLLERN